MINICAALSFWQWLSILLRLLLLLEDKDAFTLPHQILSHYFYLLAKILSDLYERLTFICVAAECLIILFSILEHPEEEYFLLPAVA